jgi:hypothetical protein
MDGAEISFHWDKQFEQQLVCASTKPRACLVNHADQSKGGE